VVHTVDRDDDLVDVLLVGSAGSIASDASGELRAEAVHPQPDRLPADDDAPLGQQVFDVGRAQREAMVGPDRVGDHLAGKTEALQARQDRTLVHATPLPQASRQINLAVPLAAT